MSWLRTDLRQSSNGVAIFACAGAGDFFEAASMHEHDAQTDTDRVRAMIDEYRSEGLAAIGVHDVLAALANGQVDTVFLSTGLEQIHSEEEELYEALAPALKHLPEDTGIRITDALVTRAKQTGAKVTFIEDPALLADVGGVRRGASIPAVDECLPVWLTSYLQFIEEGK